MFLTLDSTEKLSPSNVMRFVAWNGNGKPANAPGQSQLNVAVHLLSSLSKLSKVHSLFCRKPWRACGAQLTLFTSW